MKAKELIKLLQEVPPDSIICVEHYNGAGHYLCPVRTCGTYNSVEHMFDKVKSLVQTKDKDITLIY